MNRTMISAEEIRRDIRAKVAELTECDLEEVTDTANFVEELEVDSLMAIELMVTLDKQYDIDISEEEFRKIVCVNDAVACVQRYLSNGDQ